MIAIHKASGGFSDRWISYCDSNAISYKIVNCYENDIISQLSDCSALMWQYYQGSIKDFIMAKALMNALEIIGIKSFPDFKTAWHFDDKVGQKYLLEAIGAPLASTWVFYNKLEALDWVAKADFPKVFKLRGGAGSQNVRLVNNRKQARKLVRKAFGRGFPTYDAVRSLRERWRLYRLGKTNFRDLLEGFARLFIVPPYSRVKGPERGYIYFQEYIAGNDSDIRVIVIDDKAFGIKRMVRKGDFTASGSGNILYDKVLIDEGIVKLSFEIAEKLKTQCVAFDFVQMGNKPLVVEISYGFSPAGYDPCPGYWDKEMNWHEGRFNPYGWIVEMMII
jgi:hypothetical protein